MKHAFILRGLSAAAHLALTAALACWLPPDRLGAVLFVIAMSGLAATLATAGTAQAALRSGSRNPSEAGAILFSGLRSLVLPLACGAFLIALSSWIGLGNIGALDLGWGMIATIAMAAGNIAGAVLRAVQPVQIALLPNIVGRPSLALFITGLAVVLGDLGQLALPAFALAQVICCSLSMVMAPRPLRGGYPVRSGGLWRAQTGWLLLSQGDMLVAGISLDPRDLGLYLAARRVAASVSLAQDAVRLFHAPRVARAAGIDQEPAIRAANRAFRITTGASLIALAVIAWVASQMLHAFDPLLILMLGLAFSLPALAGATGLILTMTGEERRLARLFSLSLPLGAAVLAIASQFGPAALAIGVAVALGFHAVLSGRVVARVRGQGPVTPLAAE